MSSSQTISFKGVILSSFALTQFMASFVFLKLFCSISFVNPFKKDNLHIFSLLSGGACAPLFYKLLAAVSRFFARIMTTSCFS